MNSPVSYTDENDAVMLLAENYAAIYSPQPGKVLFLSCHADQKAAQIASIAFAVQKNTPYSDLIVRSKKPVFTVMKLNSNWVLVVC